MSQGRIILFDPDIALARTLTRIIRDAGYAVVAISTVEELPQALGDGPASLLLVDLVAVGCDRAPDIAGALSHARPRPDLLLVSSLPPDADCYRQLGATPGDFIAKPVRVHELLARIKSQLREHAAPAQPAESYVRASAAVMADMTTGLTQAEVFQLLVRRVAQGLRIPRCSIILARVGDARGTVVAAYDNPSIQSLPVDLARYPEIQQAMETGDVVHVADVASHPLYDEVRDAWRADGRVLPVTSAIAIRFSLRGEPAGVFFLRTADRDAPLDGRDVTFAREIIEAAVRTLERIAAEGTGAPAGA